MQPSFCTAGGSGLHARARQAECEVACEVCCHLKPSPWKTRAWWLKVSWKLAEQILQALGGGVAPSFSFLITSRAGCSQRHVRSG